MTVIPLAGERHQRIVAGVRAALATARPPATELPWHHLRLSGLLPPGTERAELEHLADRGLLTMRDDDEIAAFEHNGQRHGPWRTTWFGLRT